MSDTEGTPGADLQGLPVHIAKVLRVERSGAGKPARLYIDGELFPFATVDGFTVQPARNQLPSVRLTIVATERVEVLDEMGPISPVDPQ